THVKCICRQSAAVKGPARYPVNLPRESVLPIAVSAAVAFCREKTCVGLARQGIAYRRGLTADPLTHRGLSRSLLKVQPHEAGHFLAHERRALAVDLLVLLARLLPVLRVAGRVQRLQRRLEVLLPLGVLLLELLLADALRRGNQGDAVPDDEVELAVAVEVGDPDPGRMGGAGQGALPDGLPGPAL